MINQPSDPDTMKKEIHTDQSIVLDIAVTLPLFTIFQYKADPPMTELCHIGKRVIVPFRNRKVMGYIINVSLTSQRSDLKYILDVIDDIQLFQPCMIAFYQWISEYYYYPLGQVIKSALPEGLIAREHTKVVITEDGQKALDNTTTNPLESQVLTRIKSNNETIQSLTKKNKDNSIPISLIRLMKKKNWIDLKSHISGGKKLANVEKFVLLNHDHNEKSIKLSNVQEKILSIIQQHQKMSIKQLKEYHKNVQASLNAFKKKGVIDIIDQPILKDIFGEPIQPDDSLPELSDEQTQVMNQIMEHIDIGFQSFLLFGVTGSGKTEVYMRITAEVIHRQKSALILVPEIALISQIGRQFRSRFGDCVAILHSNLSRGERFDQWMRIIKGDISIVIGARSAIYAPLNYLGVIIVDEEHDPSYKQSIQLKYHARDLAVMRGKLENCIVILGSATPAVQSFYNSIQNRFISLIMNHRIANRKLPDVSIVDLKQYSDKRGIQRYITKSLQEAIQESLSNGEQVLLFLNRRGYSSLPVCASCGATLQCQNCDISLTYHKKEHAYKCHYCGFTRAFSTGCGQCGSVRIKLLGFGTEKMEEYVKALFPMARVKRMDQDTTKQKGASLSILKQMKDQKIDILLGTQMIAKGHDFQNITLVGVICADLSLNFPDFRSGERTFQLLAQVAGRAGRGDRPGRVIIQTYTPKNFIIQTAMKQDYCGFYEQEIQHRKTLRYPPFSRMVQLLMTGSDSDRVKSYAHQLGSLCRTILNSRSSFAQSISILGPVPAPISRMKQQYRWQILLKGMHIKILHVYFRYVLNEEKRLLHDKNIHVLVDVDPVFMM